MSGCKCGKEGCDGTVCMCGTSCGCESVTNDFQKILDMKENFFANETAFLKKMKDLEDAQDALAFGKNA